MLAGANAAFTAAAGESRNQAGDAGARPNILLIHCDQQRYDCLGYTGNDIVSTPNIDRLAAQGMRFDRAYTPIATSCPARQCLLSGLWPESHGGLWNYDISLPVRLFDSPTWTERLQQSGYAAGYVGKWHVHPVKTPLDFGFDEYIPYSRYTEWKAGNKIESNAVETGKTKWMGGYSDMPKEDSRTHWLVGQAIGLIEKFEAEGRPWHLRLDHPEPHLPCVPVREFYDLYADTAFPEWGNFRDGFEDKPRIHKQQVYNWGLEDYSWEDWEEYLRGYFGMISQLDDAIGILLAALENMGIMNKTMVVYTTDHGDAAGSHRMIDKHYVTYEEEVHVPLIIRWDGVVEAGTMCDKFVIHELDLAATFSDLAGLGFETQGASLLPLLKGESPENWREYGFSNYNGQQFGLYVSRMIRDGRYKYVWNPTDMDEFYDLESDPWEMHNAIGDPAYERHIERMRRALYEDLQKRSDPVANSSSGAKQQLIDNKKAG